MTWPITILDHSLVSATRCVTCHSPGHKTTTVRPVNQANGTPHPVDDNCENCHQSAGVSWAGALGKPGNHDTLTSGCSGCHTKDKPSTHIPTANNNCENCHRPNQLSFKPWLTWTHSPIQTSSYGCNQCHDGTHPDTTGRSGKHILIIGTSGCNLCHKSTSVWTVPNVDHTQTSGTCVSCHKPNNPPVKTSKATDTRAGGHIAANDDCNACHKNQNPGGWATHIMDHSQVTGTCASLGCHDTKKATVNHFPTTPSNAECGPTCHSPTLADWANAKYTHTDTNCNSCHGITKTYTGVVTDAAKFDPKHMTDLESKYAMQCSVCHTGTNVGNFANKVNYFASHRTPVDMAGHETTCSNCHNTGTIAASIKGFNNGGYKKTCASSVTCSACHTKYDNGESKHSGLKLCEQPTCAGSGCHSHDGRGF